MNLKFVCYLYEKICVFWRNLHHWQKFYTAACNGRIDKYHLWSRTYGEKKNILKKKQDRQLQIKYLWEKRWHGADNGNVKSDINLFLRQNSPPPLTPRLRPHKFSMYIQNISEQAIFFFSVSQNAQELS